MRLRLITAATETPISLDEAKEHLRVTDTAEDDGITAMVAAATNEVDGRDGELGRALCTQTWELMLDRFPACDDIEIPLPPLQSVASITYVDADGATQTLATSVYGVDPDTVPGVAYLKYNQEWPRTREQRNAVVIRFVAGYGAASAVPDAIKSAIKLLVGDLYANREAKVENTLARNQTVEALLFPYRMML